MSAQQAHFESTIIGLKSALRRKARANEDDDGEILDYDINGGRKRRTDYARGTDGQYGSPTWKRKIEHAGYVRSVVSINQPRLDADGDIVEEDEVEQYSDDDVSSNDGNPYKDIKLEEILAPITSAAALPDHPTQSLPYTSPHLTNLQEESARIMRNEHVALASAKHVLTKFRGDIDWAACELIQTAYDDMFMNGVTTAQSTTSTTNGQPHARNGSIAVARDSTSQASVEQLESKSRPMNGIAQPMQPTTLSDQVAAQNKLEQDTEMADVALNGVEAKDAAYKDNDEGTAVPAVVAGALGETSANGALNGANGTAKPPAVPDSDEMTGVQATTDEEDTGSQPMHRMTTRNRARARSESQSPPTSPTSTHAVHPFFEFPTEMLPDPNCGLPTTEAEETRALLLLYIQKYEEISRNAEELNANLLRADRMRHDVFKWCKAEAHVGEMSDGEDWYDKEEWGLDEDLIKGKDEEDDEPNTVAKKTRQRRRGEGKD